MAINVHRMMYKFWWEFQPVGKGEIITSTLLHTPPHILVRNNPFDKIYKKLNGHDGYFEFPLCVDIELINNCNLHYLFFPTWTWASVRNKDFMTEETFINIMNSLKGYYAGLHFSRWGEPTLHKNIVIFLLLQRRIVIYWIWIQMANY